ncbi:VP11 [Lishui pangolin virus]|nr:VP11 [Lishui pangolin virus]
MAEVCIVGPTLEEATAIIVYKALDAWQPAKILCKPLLTYVLLQDKEVLFNWKPFQKWTHENGVDEDDPILKDVFDIGRVISKPESGSVIFRRSRAGLECGHMVQTNVGGRQSYIFSQDAAAFAVTRLHDLLRRSLKAWINEGMRYIVDWHVASSYSHLTPTIESIGPLKMLSEDDRVWDEVLDGINHLAEARETADAESVDDIRRRCFGAMLCFGVNMGISTSMLCLLESEKCVPRIMREIADRIKVDPCAVPQFSVDPASGNMGLRWKVERLGATGRNFTVRFPVKLAGTQSGVAYEEADFKL